MQRTRPLKKKRIRVSSAKAKGRELQRWTCQQIADITGYEWGCSGSDSPIESRPMGQHGCDVRMESHVRKLFPFTVECKRRETWSVPEWIEHAKTNCLKETDWLLIMRRSYHPPVVVMDAEAFFRIYSEFVIKRKGG